MVPFGNFSAPTHALGELLMKVDSCHKALGPKITEVVDVVPTVANVSVTSKSLLEFKAGSETGRSVAFPL